MRAKLFALCLLLLCLAPGIAAPASQADATEPGEARVTVSGVSAGAYMAIQVHLALSGTIDGAALVAAGPWGCAEGNLMHALGRCISGAELLVEPLVEAARKAAASGEIDPLEGLASDRAWLFHGQGDAVIGSGVTRAARDFYRAFLAAGQVTLIEDVPAPHGWPTLDQGLPCDTFGGDYLNACGYDTAGVLLQYLYGELAPRTESRVDALQTLPQAGMVPDGAGFADAGFAYVPAACADDPAACRLHIAFHGCRQGKEFIEDRFARQAGFNEWAEANRIVVLYPQVDSSVFNPQGCWDWWGYTGANYDHRDGGQIAGISALIEAWTR